MTPFNVRVRPMMPKALAALLVAVLAFAPAPFAARAAEASSNDPEAVATEPGSPTPVTLEATIDTSPVFGSGALDPEEAAGLLYMVEEEKLAHDLYLEQYDLWKLPAFQRIASSEAAHMAAVSRLLDEYGLEDPAQNNPVGVFANPQLQALYDSLLKQASESPEAALQAAVSVEEIDIQDLESRIAETDEPAIQQVYANLLRGSRRHLRTFSNLVERTPGSAASQQQFGGMPLAQNLRPSGTGRHGRLLP